MTTTEMEETETAETLDPYDTLVAGLPFDMAEQDDVTRAIGEQVLRGLVAISEANVLLSEDNRAKVADIDKALREYKGDSDELKALIAARTEAEKAAKEAIDATRNLYRVEVLHEDAIEEPEVDKEKIKASRKVVLDSLTALKGFATINSNEDVLNWIENLQIPQVGREGVTIVGQKKARVYVTVGDTVHESFGAAAKAMSDPKKNVLVTSTDLNQAWADSGEASEFEFNGQTIKVQPKPSKKELEAAEANSDEDLMSIDFDEADEDEIEEADSEVEETEASE